MGTATTPKSRQNRIISLSTASFWAVLRMFRRAAGRYERFRYYRPGTGAQDPCTAMSSYDGSPTTVASALAWASRPPFAPSLVPRTAVLRRCRTRAGSFGFARPARSEQACCDRPVPPSVYRAEGPTTVPREHLRTFGDRDVGRLDCATAVDVRPFRGGCDRPPGKPPYAALAHG